MTKSELLQIAHEVFAQTVGNVVDGITIFDVPFLSVGSADDPLWEQCKEPAVVGPWYIPPKEWLPDAVSVCSFFLPFSAQVRDANRQQTTLPALEWCYGRVEGQKFIQSWLGNLEKRLNEQTKALAPILDPRYAIMFRGEGIPNVKQSSATYGATWSDRHAAYICGMGTFGISRNLLTKHGTAGRFASILLTEPLPVDSRDYTGIYDYCTNCGACSARCPANAIDPVKGKNVALCDAYVRKVAKEFAPRFGCGLCQVGTPCECGQPKKQ